VLDLASRVAQRQRELRALARRQRVERGEF
jgi:hypothetical protein